MKKLIIVHEEKCKNYADFLSQLISCNDDTEECTIGTKDGEVTAVVWSEKEYKSNTVNLSSNQHILFIGNNKFVKAKGSNMKIEFSKFGMKYGWLGKQAILIVENPVDVKEYEAFVEFAKNYEFTIENKQYKRKIKMTDNAKKPGTAVAALAAAASPLIAIPLASTVISTTLTANKKIIEQQYQCITKIFYLEGLSKFLEQ